jgi:hypothetical protein
LANAELIGASSASAVERAGDVGRLLARTLTSPSTAATELSAAEQALADALASYQQAEGAVFYVDPGVPEELSAQPDPLSAAGEELRPDAFREIAVRLERLKKFAEEGFRESELSEASAAMAEVAALTVRLETDLAALAAAWEPGDGGNFRASRFLASTPWAVARILQGMLAISGDVLPRKWLGTEAPVDPPQVRGRVRALEVMFAGGPEGAPGLRALIAVKSPGQAAALEAALARAAALSDALQEGPADGETRRQLLAALDAVTRELTRAAEGLGIEIVEVRE